MSASPQRRPRSSRPSADGILEAAERLFEHQPYAEVSLRQLMAAAQVSTTAFYARFDSKAAVLEALAQRFFAELHSGAAETLAEVRSLDEGITRGVALLCDHLGRHRALVRMLLAEAGASTRTLAVRRRAYGFLVDFLAGHFAALAARGRVAAPEPTVLAWALVGALEMQVMRWAVWQELDLEQLAANLVATGRALTSPGAASPASSPTADGGSR
jgi:AcrR family transcriptional regulator